MLDISSRYFQGYCFPFSEKRLGLRLVVIDCNRTYIYFLSIDCILMINFSVFICVCACLLHDPTPYCAYRATQIQLPLVVLAMRHQVHWCLSPLKVVAPTTVGNTEHTLQCIQTTWLLHQVSVPWHPAGQTIAPGPLAVQWKQVKWNANIIMYSNVKSQWQQNTLYFE